eukprot:augustus_masked-scaffold_5-processed-gene-19.52-mRNA-1 protein AED:1.00 eAED:1.00 QI:0/-1/0/0/-1/1/1/0/278
MEKIGGKGGYKSHNLRKRGCSKIKNQTVCKNLSTRLFDTEEKGRESIFRNLRPQSDKKRAEYLYNRMDVVNDIGESESFEAFSDFQHNLQSAVSEEENYSKAQLHDFYQLEQLMLAEQKLMKEKLSALKSGIEAKRKNIGNNKKKLIEVAQKLNYYDNCIKDPADGRSTANQISNPEEANELVDKIESLYIKKNKVDGELLKFLGVCYRHRDNGIEFVFTNDFTERCVSITCSAENDAIVVNPRMNAESLPEKYRSPITCDPSDLIKVLCDIVEYLNR